VKGNAIVQKRRGAFVVVSVAALICAACGRQVTPNPAGLGPGGTPPGYIAFFFNVASPFNFGQYQYMIVLNTSGSGVTPSTDTVQTNWAGYVFDLVAAGNGISSWAKPYYLEHGSNPHAPPGWYPLGTTPQTFSYNLNGNGTGTVFEILAKRVLFDYNPSPSPSPSSSPSNAWTFNAFVAQAQPGGNWTFYDSMGAGGPIDPQFVCCQPPLNMAQCFDNTYYASYQAGDPTAQITTIEIANNPLENPCSS
jgi:hypothetical protein